VLRDTCDENRMCGGERAGLQCLYGGPEARVGLGGDFRGLLAVRGVLLREVAVRAGRDGVSRVREGLRDLAP
jgi:hypothetical protein